MSNFSTNAYGRFYAPESKEYIQLDQAATIEFQPTKRYDLTPANAESFCKDLEKYSKQYGTYIRLKRVPTTRTVDDADANIITLGDHVNILQTYQSVTSEIAQNVATETWGDQSWTETDGKQIIPLSAARGEIGVGGRLNDAGKKKFVERWHSKILASVAIALLSDNAQQLLRVHEGQYEWANDDTGEVICDGITTVYFILQNLRPSVKIDTLNELQRLQNITLAKHNNNIVTWLSALEQKRAAVTLRSRDAISDDQFILQIFNGAALCGSATFRQEASSLKQRWLNDDIGTMTRTTICSQLKRMYINMDEDGTWALEYKRTDQIIALTTQCETLTNALADKERTIALATSSDFSTSRSSQYQNKNANGHHEVDSWRLVEQKGGCVFHDGRLWSFCKGDHWSGGVKYNGMYCTHNTDNHEAWRKHRDEEKKKRQLAKVGTESAEEEKANTEKPDASTKKLALSEKLRTALTTQAGLSQDAFSRIWEEVDRDSGN